MLTNDMTSPTRPQNTPLSPHLLCDLLVSLGNCGELRRKATDERLSDGFWLARVGPDSLRTGHNTGIETRGLTKRGGRFGTLALATARFSLLLLPAFGRADDRITHRHNLILVDIRPFVHLEFPFLRSLRSLTLGFNEHHAIIDGLVFDVGGLHGLARAADTCRILCLVGME